MMEPSQSRRKGRLLVVLLTLVVLLAGAAIYWEMYRWPVQPVSIEAREQSVDLDKACTIRIRTNQPFDVSMRRHITLDLYSPALQVKRTVAVQEGDRLAFDADVTAIAPIVMEQLHATLKGTFGAEAKVDFPLRVSMPLFYRTNGVAFVEMIKSPPEDIYGSEITLWSTDGRLTVAGHANSAVCRQVSSSVWRLGLLADQNDPDFFVGAGCACLPPNRSADADRQAQIKQFEKRFPAVWKSFLDTAGLENLDNSIAERFFQLRLPALMSVFITETANDLVEPDANDVKRFTELLNTTSSPTPAQVDMVKALVADPAKSVDLFLASERSDSPIRKAATTMPADQLAAARKVALELYDAITTDAEAFRDLRETENSTGLVTFVQHSHATIDGNAAKTIRDAVANFATHSAGASAGGVTSAFLSQLSGGHRGMLLLPFYDRAGKEVSFRLPTTAFSSNSGGIEQFMRTAMQDDMADAARRAVDRQKENEQRILTKAKDIAQQTSLDTWLTTEHYFPFAIFDDHGRPTGKAETKRLTGLRYFFDRIENIATFRQSAHTFAELADSIKRSTSKPAFQLMITQSTLDSFLRGWELSFVDSSLQDKFKNWISAQRDIVWEQIFTQARNAKVDAMGLLGESTVFLIRLDPAHADEFIVEPRCVANVATFAVQFNAQYGITTYNSDWAERLPVNFTPQELADQKLVGDAPVTLAAAASTSIDAILKDLDIAKTTQRLDPATYSSIQVVDPLVLAALHDRMETAFSLDPAGASRKLIQRVMDFLPPAIEAQSTWVEHAGMLEDGAKTKDVNDLMNSGEWSFADDYLRFATQTQSKAGKELALKFARQIDPKYTARVESDSTALEQPSERLQSALDALILDKFKKTLQVARDLSAASQQLDGSDFKIDHVTESLDKARNDLPDLPLPEITRARGGIGEILDDIKRPHPSGIDSIDVFKWKSGIDNQIHELVRPMVVELGRSYQRSHTRGTLECLVDLQWVSGDGAAAFDLLLVGVDDAITNEKDRARFDRVIQLAMAAKKPLLKALVYTGQHYLIKDLFGDFRDHVLEPKTVEQVYPHLRYEDVPEKLLSEAPHELCALLEEGKPPTSLVGQQLRDKSKVTGVASGFTSTRVFILDTPRGSEVVKVRPITDETLSEANAAADVADHLRREGINVAAPLPAGPNKVVDVVGRYVVTREAAAPGDPLSSLRQNGSMPGNVFDLYRDAVLDIYQKGGGIEKELLAKDSMITTDDVLRQVLLRNDEARDTAALYAMADSQKKVIAENPALVGEFEAFHDDFAAALKSGWVPGHRLKTFGMVHDAHGGNFFYDASQPLGKQLTAIDFGSDYIGPAGHMFAMIAREARPDKGWEYSAFSSFVDDLFLQYEKKMGVPLTDDAKLEILRSMAIPPYKFISSDTRGFFDSLKLNVDSLPGDTLQAKLATLEGHAMLEKMLSDPGSAIKYVNELGQMLHTLRKLHDMTPNPLEKLKLEPVLKTLEDAHRAGLRLAAGDLLVTQPRC